MFGVLIAGARQVVVLCLNLPSLIPWKRCWRPLPETCFLPPLEHPCVAPDMHIIGTDKGGKCACLAFALELTELALVGGRLLEAHRLRTHLCARRHVKRHLLVMLHLAMTQRCGCVAAEVLVRIYLVARRRQSFKDVVERSQHVVRTRKLMYTYIHTHLQVHRYIHKEIQKYIHTYMHKHAFVCAWKPAS